MKSSIRLYTPKITRRKILSNLLLKNSINITTSGQLKQTKTDNSLPKHNESLSASRRHSITEKIDFNPKILIDLLKKRNLKINKKKIDNQRSLNKIWKNKNLCSLNTMTKKFKFLPGVNKLHHLTDQKIQDMINGSSENKSEPMNISFNKIRNMKKSFKSNYNLTNINNYNEREAIINIDPSINANFRKTQKNTVISNAFKTSFIQNKKKKKFVVKNKINNTVDAKSQSVSPFGIHKVMNLTRKDSDKLININNLINKNINIQEKHSKWLTSYNEYLKKFNLLNRSSMIDRLIFYLEKPLDCFEENVYEEKPGDKYQKFKNQIIRHKYKIYDTINEIKLNQIRNEVQLKRFIIEYRKHHI